MAHPPPPPPHYMGGHPGIVGQQLPGPSAGHMPPPPPPPQSQSHFATITSAPGFQHQPPLVALAGGPPTSSHQRPLATPPQPQFAMMSGQGMSGQGIPGHSLPGQGIPQLSQLPQIRPQLSQYVQRAAGPSQVTVAMAPGASQLPAGTYQVVHQMQPGPPQTGMVTGISRPSIPQTVILQSAPGTQSQIMFQAAPPPPPLSQASHQNTPAGPVASQLLRSAPATPQPPPAASNATLPSEPNQILTKKRLDELVREIDPHEQLDEDVKETLLKVADEFIESVVTNACLIAKHRKSNTLDVKDVQLCLERNWNMWIPGFGSEEVRPYKKACITEAHKQNTALIKKSLKKL